MNVFPLEPHAKARERGGVLGGWREASGQGLAEGQDRCLLSGARRKLWLVGQMESRTSVAMKLGPVCPQRERLLTPRPPLAQFSVCCVSLPPLTNS